MDYENLITITVDKNLRTLTVPNNGAVFGVVGDMSVNRICFSVPRYYSCFDMSEFTPRINYANSNGAANYYEADDLKSNENTVKFTWLLSPDVTTYIGNVKFSVQLYKKEANRVVQNFNTCYTNGKVLDGFIAENYVTPEQQETLLDKLAAQVTANIDEYLENSLVGAKDDLKVEADKYQKVITDSEKAMTDFVNSSKNDISKAATETKEEIIKEIASDENVEQINKNATNIDSLKKDIGEISKKQGYLSSYVTDSTIKINNEIYDVTTIIDELLKKDVKKIVVDVDCYVQKSIIPKNGIEIVGNGKSVIYFESGDGFNFSEGSDNASIHDLIIKGYNIQDDVNVKDNWLINISSDLHNIKLYNLDIESGYNGIKINGWINNYQNIIVSSFKGIGVYIGRSDNTFNTFFINGCQKEGLYISSNNNRIDNIKILSCGKNSDSSCFFKGNRNTISNVEIQDIYNKCAIFEDFNNNILNINLDGIRTHIMDDAPIVLAEFVNCSRNVINLIASKYGYSVNDSSKDDIISLNSNCNINSLILSSLKVALQDGGVKNNITVLKNDIVSYNINKILTLEETYSVKKPTEITYVKCTNISNEYSDAMYAFKNNGDVNYSGPRFTLKEKQKLFCVAVLSSNTAYTEQTQASLILVDQQDNMNRTKSIGNLENNQVLTLIGADDASLSQWAILNSAMSSSTITKIKYIGFFDFKDYSAIMSDIIN